MEKILSFESNQTLVLKELKNFPVGNVVQITEVKGGNSALAYFAAETDLGKYFCKLDNNNSILASRNNLILTALQQFGFPTIYPICNNSGNFLHSIPGKSKILRISPYLEMKEAANTSENYFEMGKILSNLHSIPVNNSDIQNIQSDISIETTIQKTQKIIQKLAVPAHLNREIAKSELMVIECYNKIIESLQAVESKLPKSILHGDIKLDNTKTDKDGKIIGLIDFDLCGYGPRLYDLGMAIAVIYCNYDVTKLDCDPALAIKNFIQGYIKNCELSSLEKELFSEIVQLSCLNASLWWLNDYRGDKETTIQKVQKRLEVYNLFENINYF